MTTLYGIKNCTSVKLARQWLASHGIDYHFHDLRADGLGAARIAHWVDAVGWEVLVNRRGTTWRALDPSVRTLVEHAIANAPNPDAAAIATLDAHPTLIKRPVLDHGHKIRVGFTADDYRQFFAQ